MPKLPNIERLLQLSRRKRKVKGLKEKAKGAGNQQKVEQANRILKKTRKEMYDIKKSPGCRRSVLVCCCRVHVSRAWR